MSVHEQLEKRLAHLEAECAKLRDENAQLKKQLGLSEEKGQVPGAVKLSSTKKQDLPNCHQAIAACH